ncbi:MAG TPA: hypothetical protein VGP33_17735 [Chloroflexota bacterium]|nr:hypothetical protein [Chloroflexota bacterium]
MARRTQGGVDRLLCQQTGPAIRVLIGVNTAAPHSINEGAEHPRQRQRFAGIGVIGQAEILPAVVAMGRARSSLRAQRVTTSACEWASTPGMCACSANLPAPITLTRTTRSLIGNFAPSLAGERPILTPA